MFHNHPHTPHSDDGILLGASPGNDANVDIGLVRGGARPDIQMAEVPRFLPADSGHRCQSDREAHAGRRTSTWACFRGGYSLICVAHYQIQLHSDIETLCVP